jgi:hypothetical protein
MDVIPQIDLELSNTIWSKLQKDVFKPIQLWRKKDSGKCSAFGSYQWLCQDTDLVPPWTRTSAVAKDQVLNCLTRNSRSVKRHCHIWRTSMTLPKTSHQCDARQEDLQIGTPQLNVNDSTTLHLPHRLPSSSMKLASTKRRHPQLWPTMTLGWIGLTSKYRALWGIIGTWSASCDSCNCLLIALCVLDIVCSCLVCFLSVYCYLVIVLVFGLLALKPLWCVNTE